MVTQTEQPYKQPIQWGKYLAIALVYIVLGWLVLNYKPQWIWLMLMATLALCIGYGWGASKGHKQLKALNLAVDKNQQAQQRYDELLRLTNDLIIEWTIQTNQMSVITGFNTKLAEALDQSNKTIKDWHDRVHPDDIRMLEHSLQVLIKSDRQHDIRKYRILCRDGDYATVYERTQVLRDEKNQALKMFRAIDDISEEQLRLSAIENEAQALKSAALVRLVSGAAHDYNNVLAVISGFTELLGLKTNDDKLLEYTTQIDSAVERCRQLSEQLLGYSRRRKSGQSRVTFDQVAVTVIDRLSANLPRGVMIESQLDSGGAMTVLNPTQLEIAMDNMMQNAVLAMGQQGLVHFTSQCKTICVHEANQRQLKAGRFVVFSMQDSGCGLSEKTRRQMFDPYFTTGKGVGLGLSQVYGFVQSCEGAIEVCSKPDKGCTISLYFPQI